MSDYNQIIVVKKAEDSKDVTTALNSDFIKSVSALQMLEIYFRNPVQVFNYSQSPKDFLLNFGRLVVIKVLKVILIEKEVTFFVHGSKVRKVVQIDNSIFSVGRHYCQRECISSGGFRRA